MTEIPELKQHSKFLAILLGITRIQYLNAPR